MGRNIYLTDKEQDALRDSASEWCGMMADGDLESIELVEERLNSGLGSALKKLYKGLEGEKIYEEF